MKQFSSSHQLWIRWAALIAAGILCVPGVRLMARQKRKTHHARRVVHRRRHVRIHHYRRGYYYYHHYAYLARHIRPDRVKQIQQALVKAGVLHETPNGRWDTATQKAMRQYQIQNGFTPTGLPEAKTLMKLGLGPHPLPPGLGPKPSTTGSSQDGQQASTKSSSSPPKKSSSSSSSER